MPGKSVWKSSWALAARRPAKALALCAVTMGMSQAVPARGDLVLVTPSTGTLDFGKTLVGQTATGYVTALNSEPGLYRFDLGTPTPSPPFGQQGQTIFNDVEKNVPVTGTYTFTPETRGTVNGTATVHATDSDDVTVNLTGRGVAPVQETGSPVGAGAVRVGTSGTATVMVANQGDGNQSGLDGALSDLHGTAGAGSGAFVRNGAGTIDLGDGGSVQLEYTFSPTARGYQSAGITINFTNGDSNGFNLAQNVDVTLDGTGVGPKYTSTVAPGAVVDFGTVNPGQVTTQMLDIANLTTDVGALSLTGLTLLSLDLSNPAFSVLGFTPGTVLAAGEHLLLTLQFSGVGSPGLNLGELTVRTDQGAAFGAAGQSFGYGLSAGITSVVPEPATLAMGAMAAATGLGTWLRRRCGKSRIVLS